MEKRDRFIGSMVGLAVGDCVGASVEFCPPGTFPPVTDMVGGGPFGLGVGEWTDDTSMALCLAESLLECQGFDPDDQMQKYVSWYKHGYLSSTNECFDIGIATQEALEQYLTTGEPNSGSSDPLKAGNGSIMRLAPVPLLWSNDMEQAIHYSGESSKTTHQSAETIDACYYFGALIAGAANGVEKNRLLSKQFVDFIESKLERELSPNIKEVAAGSYKHRQPPEITGEGYVVRSLEAALWAFYLTSNFKEGLLRVVNLGNDSDTTGAIYGQLAGAYYGISNIPNQWREKLVRSELITRSAEGLYELQKKAETVSVKRTIW
ncbi:ADP-ribosylglycohydrolase family protein [Peribacillus deserti]|uniref:ADP-ribosylglycohydrolase n=1 Tax=Peribacillus deserti TaxID=673318 RepID=A0A2N5M9I6_9BACI|nr:ADP-ribosylglycohydrolase family protein [Peribacillus deserti]PLT31020.1 ADP-ribosylglycohydrolase [Peribacillus deserti]